jgi:hypothetical protein
MPALRKVFERRLDNELVDDPGGRAVEGSCQCGSLARGGTIQAQQDASPIMARGMRSTSDLSRTPAGRKVLRSDKTQGLVPVDSRTDLLLVCGCLHVRDQCRSHKHVDEAHRG